MHDSIEHFESRHRFSFSLRSILLFVLAILFSCLIISQQRQILQLKQGLSELEQDRRQRSKAIVLDTPKLVPDINLNCTVTAASGGLVELSVGADDGVRPEMIFHAGRDRSYLGKLEVVKTRADASVARLLGSRGRITQGDLINVRTRID